MRRQFSIGALGFAFLLGLSPWLPMAKADPLDKETMVTFNSAVDVPGKTLPAGEYVFKLADVQERDLVLIFNKDQNHLMTTTRGIPVCRDKVVGHTVVTVSERPAGNPEALKDWFYSGESCGLEFVYANQ